MTDYTRHPSFDISAKEAYEARKLTKADIFYWLDAYSVTEQLARWKLEGESLNVRRSMGKSKVVVKSLIPYPESREISF